MIDKDFKGEFQKLFNLLTSDQGFAFSRFSDGERTVLFNKKLVLDENYFIQEDVYGDKKIRAPLPYLAEERKQFIPEEHVFFHEKLIEAYQFRKKNYFKGICGSSETEFGTCHNLMLELYGTEDEFLTFSNVLQNGNYDSFVEKMIPEFANHDIIFVANQNAEVGNLPFDVKKHFPVGTNCMINDYSLVEEIKQYIDKNNIRDALFLFSAATLSNFLCYELFKDFESNKYLDIGSTLGPLLGLEGWKNSRSYLLSYWYGHPGHHIDQVDQWS